MEPASGLHPSGFNPSRGRRAQQPAHSVRSTPPGSAATLRSGRRLRGRLHSSPRWPWTSRLPRSSRPSPLRFGLVVPPARVLPGRPVLRFVAAGRKLPACAPHSGPPLSLSLARHAVDFMCGQARSVQGGRLSSPPSPTRTASRSSGTKGGCRGLDVVHPLELRAPALSGRTYQRDGRESSRAVLGPLSCRQTGGGKEGFEQHDKTTGDRP